MNQPIRANDDDKADDTPGEGFLTFGKTVFLALAGIKDKGEAAAGDHEEKNDASDNKNVRKKSRDNLAKGAEGRIIGGADINAGEGMLDHGG